MIKLNDVNRIQKERDVIMYVMYQYNWIKIWQLQQTSVLQLCPAWLNLLPDCKKKYFKEQF